MEVTLTQAAARLKISYHHALRLVLTGRLEGEQVNGRWVVDLRSVQRMAEIQVGAHTARPVA